MHSITFWNVYRSPQGIAPLVELARHMAADTQASGKDGEAILCFCEPGLTNAAQLQAALVAADGRPWWAISSPSGKFIVLGTIPKTMVSTYPEAGGGFPCSITRVDGTKRTVYQLFFVHLASPIGASNADTHGIGTAGSLKSTIEHHEGIVANGNTVAIGDFNMRPYDAGMVAPDGMHAAACSRAAAKPRTVNAKLYSYFYNPTWELLGNWSGMHQPGTFYWLDKSSSVRWHMLDQVIVRPVIAKWISRGTPRVLTWAGPIKLLSRGGLTQKKVSDHLPITISLSV